MDLKDLHPRRSEKLRLAGRATPGSVRAWLAAAIDRVGEEAQAAA